MALTPLPQTPNPPSGQGINQRRVMYASEGQRLIDEIQRGQAEIATQTITGDLSVGGNLAVTGTTALNGAITLGDAAADSLTINATTTYTDPVNYSNQTGITAFATGGQASATQLTEEINNVTTVATAGDSVKLPAAVAGKHIWVKNSGAAALDIFPATSDSIDELAVNLAIRIYPNTSVHLYAKDGIVWESSIESLTVRADVTMAKEVNHTISVASTTTAATAGANLSIASGQGATSGNGGVATLAGGAGGATGTGGAVAITSGAGGATSGDSGAVTISSANETGTDSSGTVTVTSGTTVSDASGDLALNTGVVSTLGNSGSISVATGPSVITGNSGAINIVSGDAATGNSGEVVLTSGITETGNTGAITLTTSAVSVAGDSGAITLSSGTSANGNGGTIVLQPGTGGGAGATLPEMAIIEKGLVRKPKSSDKASGGTITARELISGLIRATGATGNWQLPSAANLITALGGSASRGWNFEFVFNASEMTATNTATLVVGAGMSVASAPAITGGDTLTVTQDTQVTGGFRVVFDTTTTCKIYRIW